MSLIHYEFIFIHSIRKDPTSFFFILMLYEYYMIIFPAPFVDKTVLFLLLKTI